MALQVTILALVEAAVKPALVTGPVHHASQMCLHPRINVSVVVSQSPLVAVVTMVVAVVAMVVVATVVVATVVAATVVAADMVVVMAAVARFVHALCNTLRNYFFELVV